MNEIKNFINPNSLPDQQCEFVDENGWGCTSKLFVQQFRIKTVNKFQSGTGQTGYVIVPVFVCAACGHELIMK